MIKDRMTLGLSVDTQYLKTTVDAQNETDETLDAYAVGFIPWDMVSESTLFNWARYNVKYTRYTAASISAADNPYSDDTQFKATKGIPFMYSVSPTGQVLQFRALYKNPETGLFESAGDAYKSGTTYNTGNTDIKNILHSVDLSDIVTNNRNATPYMRAQFTSVAILFDNDTYDFSDSTTAWVDRPLPISYDPVSDKIANITFSYNVAGVQFTRTVTDDDFKTWGKMGYSGTMESGGHKFAIFDYCTGIYCVNPLPVTGYTSAYVNGFIAANFPYRYTSTIGLHNTYNFPSSGNFSGFIQGYNSFYNATGVYTSYSSTNIDMDAFVNNDTVPSIDVTLTNDDREDITDSYYRYKTAMAFSVLMKSYTALDLKIMALISSPIIKVNNIYYCPEFDDGYALTGRWIPYTNQTLNPDDNEFDPENIPVPEEEDKPDAYGADSIPDLNFTAGAISNFITMYCLTESQIAQFGAFLWTNMFSTDFVRSVGTILANDFSLNPADILNYIVSVRKYPFNLHDRAGYQNDTSGNIYFGRGVAGIPITGAFGKMQNLANSFGGEYIDIPFQDNDFRDYEPFTRITVFVPFCGSLELTPSEVVGKRVFITYTVDYSTGNVQADVWVQSGVAFIVGTLTGQIGATVQMTASNNMEVIQKMAGTAMSISKAAVSIAAIAATAGASAETAAASGEESTYMQTTASDLQTTSKGLGVGQQAISSAPFTTSNPIHSSTTGSGFSSFATPRARLIIERRKYTVPTNYGHVYGYACNKTVVLSSLYGKGFTVCRNVDLSGIPATSDELNAIESLLTSGVYF